MKRLISLAVLVAATFSVSCSQTNQPENKVNIDASGPVIEFANLEHDYGTIVQGADGNCEFVFTNTGTQPLTLENVRSSCGCTIPEWPKEPIAPGAKGAIKVKYDTQRVGPISKTITVTSNGSQQPIILKIKGQIEPATTNQAAGQ
jgi:hypothetical protein